MYIHIYNVHFASIYVCVLHACMVTKKARRRCWLTWNWCYRCLQATMWILEIKFRSSGRTFNMLLTTELCPQAPTFFKRPRFSCLSCPLTKIQASCLKTRIK